MQRRFDFWLSLPFRGILCSSRGLGVDGVKTCQVTQHTHTQSLPPKFSPAAAVTDDTRDREGVTFPHPMVDSVQGMISPQRPGSYSFLDEKALSIHYMTTRFAVV
jgi:hypothetical protein